MDHIAATIQRSNAIGQLRAEIAGSVLGHLAAVEIESATRKAQEQQAIVGGDGPVNIELNFGQTAAVSVAYADTLIKTLGIG